MFQLAAKINVIDLKADTKDCPTNTVLVGWTLCVRPVNANSDLKMLIGTRMHINAYLDENGYQKLEYLIQTSQTNLSEVITQALDFYYGKMMKSGSEI